MRGFVIVLFIGVATSICVLPLFAATLRVPQNLPTIQTAINTALNGDTVLVAPGAYQENLILNDKAIVLRSSGGASVTAISALTTSEAVILITNSDSRQTEISGFTITGGGKGGIYCNKASPKILGNIIRGNFHDGNIGGGITLLNTHGSLIKGNWIFENEGAGYGSAIHIGASGAVSQDDSICYNVMYRNEGYGDIRLLGTVNNLQFFNNTLQVSMYGGLAKQSTGSINVRNNIVFGAPVYAFSGDMVVEFNCLFNNGANYAGGCTAGVGNVLQDALFTDMWAPDYSLQPSSPCRNAGDPNPIFNDPDTTRGDIGAIPYLDYSRRPVLLAIGSKTGAEGNQLSFRVAATDPNATIPALLAADTPSGAAFADSGNGAGGFSWTPDYSQSGVYTVTFIATDGILADSEQVVITVSNTARPPTVTGITVDGYMPALNVVGHSPLIAWSMTDPENYGQTGFEIAVGSDASWNYAELWNPAPMVATDAFVTYGGASLLDGHKYFLRLRVKNDSLWSAWSEISFRMNSAPPVPIQRSPVNLATTGSTPTLWVLNVTDGEGDAVTYDFAGFHDTDCVSGPAISFTGIPAGTDSTGAVIGTPLAENCRYWWRVRSFDGYEYSEWTPYAQFLVNGVPEAPTVPVLLSPLPANGKPLFIMHPTFTWQPSFDPDPFDTIRYKVELSLFPNFSFVLTGDGLLTPEWTVPDSLQFGTHYWWRVTARDQSGLTAVSQVVDFWTWKLGDINHSHTVDVSDLSTLIAFLVGTGTTIEPKFVADVTSDCLVDLSDLSTMIGYLTVPGVQFKAGCQ